MIGVVGAHGFIGQSLIDHCVSKHQPITAFVRHRRYADRLNFGPLPTVREVTIGEKFDPIIFKDVDTLVLAASATNSRSQNSRANEIRKNVLPHVRFVEALKKSGRSSVAKILEKVYQKQ